MSSFDETKAELKQAIHELYATFRGYHQRLKVEFYDTHDDVRLLESRPLHDLQWPQLERLANKALTTMGTLEDFKRFLPRLLELVTQSRPRGFVIRSFWARSHTPTAIHALPSVARHFLQRSELPSMHSVRRGGDVNWRRSRRRSTTFPTCWNQLVVRQATFRHT